MPGPKKVVSPWAGGPTRYRVYGGANPNGIEWELTIQGFRDSDHKKARAEMERVYDKLMETEKG